MSISSKGHYSRKKKNKRSDTHFKYGSPAVSGSHLSPNYTLAFQPYSCETLTNRASVTAVHFNRWISLSPWKGARNARRLGVIDFSVNSVENIHKIKLKVNPQFTLST